MSADVPRSLANCVEGGRDLGPRARVPPELDEVDAQHGLDVRLPGTTEECCRVRSAICPRVAALTSIPFQPASGKRKCVDRAVKRQPSMLYQEGKGMIEV